MYIVIQLFETDYTEKTINVTIHYILYIVIQLFETDYTEKLSTSQVTK